MTHLNLIKLKRFKKKLHKTHEILLENTSLIFHRPRMERVKGGKKNAGINGEDNSESARDTGFGLLDTSGSGSVTNRVYKMRRWW